MNCNDNIPWERKFFEKTSEIKDEVIYDIFYNFCIYIKVLENELDKLDHFVDDYIEEIKDYSQSLNEVLEIVESFIPRKD